MLKTPGHRTRLAEGARRANADEFIRNPVRDGRGRTAWGQFFDWSQTQYGVLGTSAGVEVVVSIGYRGPMLSEALDVLGELHVPGSEFQRRRDHLNTFKLAAHADAIAAGRLRVEPPCEAMDALRDAALASCAWADHRADAEHVDPVPTVLATSVALRSLRRYTAYEGTEDCRAALAWLCDALLHYPRDALPLARGTTLAAGLLALSAYRGTTSAGAVGSLLQATEHCERELTQWTGRRRRRELCEQLRHDFVAGPDDRDSDFIALMPDVLAALAFAQTPSRLTFRRKRHLHRVIDKTAEDIRTRRVIARNVDKRALVDHLWVQRLLSLFVSAEVQRAVRERNLVGWRVGPLAFWFCQCVLMAVVGIAAWGVTQTSDARLDAVLSVVMAVIGGVCGNAIYQRVSRRG
jgi:hypothetical protein